MAVPKYKFKKVLSSHSFGTHQITAVTFSDNQGNSFNGIAVTPVPWYLFAEVVYSQAMGDYGKPIILDANKALLFCTFIEDVLNGVLPRKISVNSGGPLLTISLNKYLENWHGGGAYKGSVGFGWLSGVGFLSNAKVTRNSLLELKNSLTSLFELEKQGDANA